MSAWFLDSELSTCLFEIFFFDFIQSNTFYKIGVLIATSVAQGGCGFPYLYKGVYEYLCGKESNNISITASVIPDYVTRNVVERVCCLLRI